MDKHERKEFLEIWEKQKALLPVSSTDLLASLVNTWNRRLNQMEIDSKVRGQHEQSIARRFGCSETIKECISELEDIINNKG